MFPERNAIVHTLKERNPIGTDRTFASRITPRHFVLVERAGRCDAGNARPKRRLAGALGQSAIVKYSNRSDSFMALSNSTSHIGYFLNDLSSQLTHLP